MAQSPENPPSEPESLSSTGSFVKVKPDSPKVNGPEPDVSKFDISEPDVSKPDSSKPDISGSDLLEVDSSKAHLPKFGLSEHKLSKSDLSRSDTAGPDPDLSKVDLSKLDIAGSALPQAHLSKADSLKPELSERDVSVSNLSKSDLLDRLLGSVKDYQKRSSKIKSHQKGLSLIQQNISILQRYISKNKDNEIVMATTLKFSDWKVIDHAKWRMEMMEARHKTYAAQIRRYVERTSNYGSLAINRWAMVAKGQSLPIKIENIISGFLDLDTDLEDRKH